MQGYTKTAKIKNYSKNKTPIQLQTQLAKTAPGTKKNKKNIEYNNRIFVQRYNKDYSTVSI